MKDLIGKAQFESLLERKIQDITESLKESVLDHYDSMEEEEKAAANVKQLILAAMEMYLEESEDEAQ